MSRSRSRLPDPIDYARAAQIYFASRYAGPRQELSSTCLAIRCVNPAAHTNGDAHPSLRVALDKGTWRCDPCDAGGGLAGLVQRLEGLPDEVAAHQVLRGLLGADREGGRAPTSGGREPAPQAEEDERHPRGDGSRRGRTPFVEILRGLVLRDRAHLDTPARAADLAWLEHAWHVPRSILDRYVVGITPAVLAPRGPAGPRTFELSCPSVGPDHQIAAIKLYRPRWKELGGESGFRAIAVKGSKPGLFGGHLFAAAADGAGEGRTVVVVGGEKDTLVAAAALERWPLILVVANARGEGGWRGEHGLAIARSVAGAKPARVVVALDANETTRGVPAAIGALRHAGIPAASLHVLTYPAGFAEAHPKGGVSQLVLEFPSAGGAEGLHRAIIEAPIAPEPPATPAPLSSLAPGAPPSTGLAPAPDDRPKIVVSSDVQPVVDHAEAALIAVPDQVELYQRAGQLVRIIRAPATGPSISSAPLDHLTELLSRAAHFVKQAIQPDGSLREIPVLPPGWAVKALAARSSWRFRHLAGIVEAPTLRRDGSLLETPGYDPASGLIYEPAAAPPATPSGSGAPQAPALIFPRILGQPPAGSTDPVATVIDYDTARAAAAMLQDLLSDFPFVADHDLSAALAALITPLVRSAIAGPCPLFGVSATTPGSGKSLLVDVASILATGREARRMTQHADPGEDAKTILSLALEGPRLVLIDNVERPLGSDALNAALTGASFSGRILGQSKTAAPTLDMVWYATGNNLELRGDMARRVIPIDLDPRCERPETRAGFRHPRLLEHARRHRGELVVAALRVVLGYLHAGRPPQEIAPYGSFDAWSDLVRSALVWLGYEDPCAGCERLRANADPALDAWSTFLEMWTRCLGPQEVTVAELLDHARRVEPLRQALAATDSRLDPDRFDPRRVGYGFRKWKGRVVGGRRLEQGPKTRDHGVRWTVVLLPEKLTNAIQLDEKTEHNASFVGDQARAEHPISHVSPTLSATPQLFQDQ